MAKAANNGALLSADDFLSAVVGEAVEHTIPGVGTVRVRGLEFAEVSRLQRTHGDDNDAMMLEAIGLVLEEPKLTEEQIERLRHAKAGFVTNLWAKIAALSAMDDSEMLEGEAGGGS